MIPQAARLAFYACSVVCALVATLCAVVGMWPQFFVTLVMFVYLCFTYLVIFFRHTDIVTIRIVGE